MCKKVIHLISLVLLVSPAGRAATIHWTGLGGDKLWSNRANWELSRIPTLGDEAYIDVPPAKAPGGPVIRDGIDAKALGLGCEVAGEPNMAMTGGTLEITDWVWWGDGAGCHGTFHMSGGTITVASEFELGWGGGTGTWFMTGGTITARELIIPTGSGAAGQLYLHGGTFNVGSDGLEMQTVGFMDVGGGTLIIEGDWTGRINGYIAAGLITAHDGGGVFELDYNERNPGKTTLSARWTGKAYNPKPPDGAYHPETWANLSWSPDAAAVSHDVYFGDDFDHVNNGTGDTFRGNQATTYFVVGFPGYPYPDGLVPGTTYYWRIDEVEADGTTHEGDVWSFTIPPRTVYNPEPADGAESVALDSKLSWTAGFGAKLHTVYFGDDYDTVGNATGGLPQGTTTYAPSALQAEKVYYWRVDEFDAVATHKGSVWAFTTPGAVGKPQPANRATGIQMTAKLSWTAATNATSHQVYFGTDKDAVRSATTASPEYKGSKALGSETLDPGKLAWHSTYYWRVDAVHSTGTVKGLVWSFTTADFITVDDFEPYNDIDPPDPASNRIFDNWIDGFGTTDNGALVGNEMPPYAERIAVHSGAQSMPYRYDNANKTSEATLTLVYPRDWTEEGVTKLSLWLRGASANAAERLYVALNGSAVVYHDDPAVAQAGQWTEWVIDLQVLQGVTLTNVNTITIGFGTKGSPAAGGAGKMYFDDIRLYR